MSSKSRGKSATASKCDLNQFINYLMTYNLQLDNIRKFLIKNCNLSDKQINNRLEFIYKI